MANAKGAFRPRQEQPNITSLTDPLRRPYPPRVEELEAHPLLLARYGLLDACDIALHDWIRLEIEILGSFIEAVRLPRPACRLSFRLGEFLSQYTLAKIKPA
jgi:hypothetical protein